MIDRTLELISKFNDTRDVQLLPSIFINLYETPHVAMFFKYNDCMRILRNKAAHSPDALVRALVIPANKNCAQLSINDTVQKTVYINWAEVFINLYNLYANTVHSEYIHFARNLAELMSFEPSRYICDDADFQPIGNPIFAVNEIINKSPALRQVMLPNSYYFQMMTEEPAKYLRVAIPDWFGFILMGVNKIHTIVVYSLIVALDSIRTNK